MYTHPLPFGLGYYLPGIKTPALVHLIVSCITAGTSAAQLTRFSISTTLQCFQGKFFTLTFITELRL